MRDKPMTDRDIEKLMRRARYAETMDETEKLALAKTLVECTDAIGLDPTSASGADLLDAIRSMKTELDRLREATRWRDAAKEWPEVGDVILFAETIRPNARRVGRIGADGRVYVQGVVWCDREEVKCWMPLPEPQKDGDK